jgi:hypothetical protein
MPEILRDGEENNITCMLNGGRPNPDVYFNISGSELSSANSHFYNSTSSLHTNVITLTTFKKEWNKENITCCRYNKWYKIAGECSSPKQVNYMCTLFSILLFHLICIITGWPFCSKTFYRLIIFFLKPGNNPHVMFICFCFVFYFVVVVVDYVFSLSFVD